MGPETQNARFIEGTKKISRERWDKGLERRAAAGAGLLLESHEMSVLNESFTSVQFSPVAQSYPMSRSTPGLPVHHHLPEFTQTHVHRVSDATQPSHSLSFPSPPAFNLSQHQDLFKWVNSSHQVAKVLEFQLHPPVLPMNIWDWFPLGWTGWILQSKGLSKVFSNTTVHKLRQLTSYNHNP